MPSVAPPSAVVKSPVSSAAKVVSEVVTPAAPMRRHAASSVRSGERDAAAFLGRPVGGIVDLHGRVGEGGVGQRLAPERHAFHEILDLLEIAARPLLLEADELPARLAVDFLGDVDAVQFPLVGQVAHHVGVGGDVGEERAAARVGLDRIPHAAHDHVAGKDRALGAVREGEGQHAPILDIDRIGLDEGALLGLEAGGDVADIGGDVRHGDALAARFRLDLLQVEHGGERVAAHADERAAAGHRPLRGMRGVRAAVALLGLHEEDLVLGGLQDLDRLRHRRGINPILRVHEKPAAGFDRGAGRVHFLQHAPVHHRLRHMLADRRLVAGPAEIPGEGLLADDVLAPLERRDDHRRVRGRRRADVDDVDIRVGEERAEIAMAVADAVLAREVNDAIAARRHRGHLDLDAVDPLVGVHVQLRGKAAADQAHPDFRHRHAPSLEGASYPRRRGSRNRGGEGWLRGDNGKVFTISPVPPSLQQAPSGPSCPTSTMVESWQMAYRKEFVEALRLLAPAFERLVAEGQPRPVLVGGAAVEFYTGSAVVSGDFDVVTEAQDAFEAILLDLGFVREASGRAACFAAFITQTSKWASRSSAGVFSTAIAMRREFGSSISAMGSASRWHLSKTLIADRMGQYCATKARVPEMLDQAIKLYQLAEDVDEAYLDRRIQEETQGEYDIEYLKAASR